MFLAFSLSFFLVTTGVLLYVYGYRFSFERGIFIYSGSITIKATPEEVSIKIDGEEVPPNKTGILNQSYLVSGLLPGKHFVEVSAPGYTTWAKDVIIRSGLSTEFWNVFLVESSIGKTHLAESENTKQVYPAPKSPTLVVFAEETATGVSIILADTETGEEERDTLAEFPGAKLLPNTAKENVEWSADERYVLVPLLTDGNRDTAIIRIKRKTTRLLSEVTDKPGSTRVRWNPEERTNVFYLDQDSLVQTDATDTTLAFITNIPGVLAYDLSDKFLFYFKNDGHVYRTSMDAENERGSIQITKKPLSVDKSHRYTLISYNQSRFTLLNQNTGSLHLYNRFGAEVFYEPLLTAKAEGSQFSNDGKKLLYYTDTEAFVYFLRDWKVQPVRTRGDVQPVLRLATPLQFPQWSKDYEHILYVSDGSLKLIELDSREAQYIQNIAHFNTTLLQFLPRFAENKLYFVIAPEGAPSSVQSLEFPKRELSVIEELIQ
jgi:hypothetical protein